jgi:hypothetical protein
VATEQDLCYSTGDVNHGGHPQYVQGAELVVLNSCSVARKFLTDEIHLFFEQADHVNLPCSGIYTLISKFPDDNPIRYLVKLTIEGL